MREIERHHTPIAIYIVGGVGCGGCVLETESALAPTYAAHRQRIRRVDAPAHADLLIVCGEIPAPLAEEVQQLRAKFHAPWACLQLGDCVTQGIDLPEKAIVAGCPPTPEQILEAIRATWSSQRAGRAASPPAATDEEAA